MSLLQSIDNEIWIALIPAVISLVVAIAGFLATGRNQKELERLKGDVSERLAVRNAKLEYEFDARKRLYQECGPLLFQLSEFAERARGRIIGLARTAADGDLSGEGSWLNHNGYYFESTYYRFLAPLAIGKLLQKKLTHIDLSLDPSIHWQYTLLKAIANTFTDDFDLAGKKNGAIEIDESDWLNYHPNSTDDLRKRDGSAAIYEKQGIVRGILETAVSVLIAKDDDGNERVIDFREFQDARSDNNTSIHKSFERISYLLTGFHPDTRPVLWRILAAQAHLYQAILSIQESEELDHNLWDHLWEKDNIPSFDWREKTTDDSSDDAITTAVKLGMIYARDTTSKTLEKLMAKNERNRL